MQQLLPVGQYGHEFTNGVYTSGGAGDLGGTSAIIFLLVAPVPRVRFLFTNYSISTSTGEVNTGSTLTIQASMQAVNGVGTPVQLTFGGNNSVTLLGGQAVYSDWAPLTGSVTGQSVGVRTFVQVPANGNFPIGPYNNYPDTLAGISGSCGVNYPQVASGNGSNQLLTAGQPSTWITGSNNSGYGPVEMDGNIQDGIIRPVIGGIGDSRMAGQGDNASTGGFFRRALYQMNLPFKLVAMPGELAYTNYIGNVYQNRFQRVIKDCTAMVYSYGGNDWGSGYTPAQFIAYSLLFFQALAMRGATIFACTLLPDVTYSGNIYPVSQQTLIAPHKAYNQAWNAYCRAPASAGSGNSIYYDCAALGIPYGGTIDIASYIETNASNAAPGGPSAPLTGGYWYCGAGNNIATSIDGIHPNYAGTVLMLPAMLAKQAAFLASVQNMYGAPYPFFPNSQAVSF